MCGSDVEHHSNILDDDEIRGSLFIRLIQLTRGYSGVSFELLYSLINLLNNNVLPLIPYEGSLGASGDLVPMGYIASTIEGSKYVNVKYNNKIMKSSEYFKNNNLKFYKLKSKEGLAIVNGTSVCCGILSLLINKIEFLIKLSSILTGLMSNVLKGNPLKNLFLVHWLTKKTLSVFSRIFNLSFTVFEPLISFGLL